MFSLSKKLKLIFPVVLIASFLIGSFALAQINVADNLGTTFGLTTQTLKSTLINVINIALGFLGILAITFILYGGFVWMTAAGSPEKVEKAKKILVSALIGLAIILLSFAIVQFIVTSVTGGGGPSAGDPCDCLVELDTCAVSGCLRCQTTIDPLVCTWQNDGFGTCPGCPGTVDFEVTSIMPPEPLCPVTPTNTVPVNSVIRIYFNKPVDLASVDSTSIRIRSSNSQCPALALVDIGATGQFTVIGNRVEFRPSTGNCVPNSCGADRCFDIDSTIDIDVILGLGGVTSGGQILSDNLTVNENPSFLTNDLIDCESPIINLLSGDQICLGVPNNLGFDTTDDSGVSQVVLNDDNGDFAFPAGTPVTVPCPGPGFCGNPMPWVVNPATVWTPTNANYLAGEMYTVTATASDLDDNTTLDSRTFTLRPAHCCNGEADYAGDPDLNGGLPEEGIDCGGDCGACLGGACGNDLDTACAPMDNCSDNNDICASNLCGCDSDAGDCAAVGYSVDPCCICQEAPIIDCVTPSQEDTCEPNHTPIGTTGNLITIWGRNFGTYVMGLSRVTINGNPASLAEDANGLCVNSWTNTQIIVVVPAGSDGGVIEVTNASDESDATDDTRGIFIDPFFDDGLVRPGVCAIENNELGDCLSSDCGRFQDQVTGHGINILVGSTTDFGGQGAFIAGDNPVPNPDLEINCNVPNLDPGDTGFSIVSADSERSNYVNFRVRSSIDGPHIDFLDPESGPEGQYVTINGSGFGNSVGIVYFQDTNSIDTVGSFDFPSNCDANDYWSASYIIVKVPDPLAAGAYEVRIVTSGGDESNEEDFTVCNLNSTTCPLSPGICGIDPSMAPIGNTNVRLFGENFGSILGAVDFYNAINSGISSWGNNITITSEVPLGSETGPVILTDNAGNESNGYPFEVGECDPVGASGPPTCPGTDTCCEDRTCRASCDTPYSTYTWTFTTGDYFVREDCDPAELDPVIPSPTPWSKRSGGTNVCINAEIGASFTEDIQTGSVNVATVIVEECGNDSSPGVCTGQINAAWPITGYPSGTGINAFITYQNGVPFAQNTWYRITLVGGNGNITSVAGDPLIDDYIWYFKTSPSDQWCDVTRVSVSPNPAKLVEVNAMQDFIATIRGDDPCIILNPSLYSWSWESTDNNVATVSGAVVNTDTATALFKGETYIKATVLPNSISGQALLEVDFLGLNILNHWYECDAVCINAELGLRFDKEVDDTTLTTGLPGGNINIYRCDDGVVCSDYTNNFVPITNPSYLWNIITGDSITNFSPNPDFAIDAYYRVVVASGNNGVKSILGAPLATINSDLAFGEECDDGSLFCSAACLWTGDACGTDRAECVDVANPELDNKDGCSDNCLNEGSIGASTCGDGVIDGPRESCDYDGMCATCVGDECTSIPNGDTYYFCRDSVTDCEADTSITNAHCETIANNGCSDSCLLTGSTHTAICGNGTIEWGEACDDNNQTNGDGCNNRCLKEGSVAPDCGNGAIGVNEDCDDGNTNSGDGCSSNCLSEGAPWSICGDGRVGIGEDCDDGNTSPNDGCSPSCLNEGSQGLADCENNIVEKNERDHFSWVFKTGDHICEGETVDVIPNATTAYFNEVVPFKATLRGPPDTCDPQGQTLNPWGIDWNWASNDINIATVSDYQAVVGISDPIQDVTADDDTTGTTNINAQAGAAGPTDFGTITVEEPAPPGTPCVVSNCCDHGVSTCSPGHECITSSEACDDGDNTFINNCRCCCDPTNDECPGSLFCHENISPCTVCYDGNPNCRAPEIPRGMCCGCEENSDCSVLNPSYLCGENTCCYPRPNIIEHDPMGADICRNVLISALFQITGFEDEKMDTRSFKGAIHVVDPNSIEVEGRIFARDETMRINFAPTEPLEPDTIYTVTIDNTVQSEQGIAMGADYSWNFITGNDICDIDYIRVDVEVGDAPPEGTRETYYDVDTDLFICANKDDCRRDVLLDAPNPGNQHLFHAIAIDDGTGNELVSDDFIWSWEEDDPQDVFEIPSPFGDPIFPDDTDVEATSHLLDGSGYLNIEADGGTTYGSANKKVRIMVFLCENPWPSMEYWPWEDEVLGNPSSDCNVGAGACNDTYFELFYCRDNGGPGIFDDLPAIASDPLVFAESGDLVKELFFIEKQGTSGGPIVLSSSVTPCLGMNGQNFTIQSTVTDFNGVNSVIAYIQDPDEVDLATVTLNNTVGDTYVGNWTSSGCAGFCSYFVDIIAIDNDGHETEIENVTCVDP
ncbi:DUF4215 domain-containing protein [Candidatus Falkowbacteria bacterium]|jgi:cysteine-rich repeat protein|nr:DUF4215 domain-containing protein [Candidatus Falkowbacteria bacterium]MBT4433032.1 DUF4215 domain-containing protein [Candidatus Falkowbacteria bacterium]